MAKRAQGNEGDDECGKDAFHNNHGTSSRWPGFGARDDRPPFVDLCLQARPYPSILIFASAMIGPHLFISALMCRSSSSGVEPTGVIPNCSSLAFMVGSPSAATVSA